RLHKFLGRRIAKTDITGDNPLNPRVELGSTLHNATQILPPRLPCEDMSYSINCAKIDCRICKYAFQQEQLGDIRDSVGTEATIEMGVVVGFVHVERQQVSR